MSQKLSRRDIVRGVTRRLIDEPAERQVWIRRLAAYLTEHRMTNQADLIVNDIAHELEVQAGLLTVEVVSARQLADDVRQSLKAMLADASGAKDIALYETTDNALLGGFIARTADAEIDASVQTKLKRLASLA